MIDEAKFWARVDKSGECWLWTGCCSRGGWPRFHIRSSRRAVSAHRVSWESAHGPLRRYDLLVHSCGERRCVNPAHLSIVTPVDDPQKLSERFWRCVSISDSCWEWTGYISRGGYGRFNAKTQDRRRLFAAHRFAWSEFYGSPPDALDVCHHCDNPRCVRPSHLFLGTALDNMRDMCAKGRKTKGEQRWNAKLTEADVRNILADHARDGGGYGYRALSTRYGVGRTTIRGILARRTWTHVTPTAPASEMRR